MTGYQNNISVCFSIHEFEKAALSLPFRFVFGFVFMLCFFFILKLSQL